MPRTATKKTIDAPIISKRMASHSFAILSVKYALWLASTLWSDDRANAVSSL